MANSDRIHCPYCGSSVTKKMDGEVLRDYCASCRLYFYDNPLPVASAIVVKDRMVALVKRKNEPYLGKWCLPSGFAEIGESIESAVLRELQEETGMKGKIIGLIDVNSIKNYYYGDLIFVTYEVEHLDGEMTAGDDAEEVKLFPVFDTPELAFKSNTKALKEYIKRKADSWAIIDSFSLSQKEKKKPEEDISLLSNQLVELVEKNADVIAGLWLDDVRNKKSTITYHNFDRDKLFERNKFVISQFGNWLSKYGKQDIRKYYEVLGKDRKREGFKLSEVISALSLTKKHIWEFALSQGIGQKLIDIYKLHELERRLVIFFDKAAYYIVRGYESGSENE